MVFNEAFALMGGGVNGITKHNSMDPFLYLLIFFFIKIFLVQYTYNTIAPRLIMNFSDRSISNFRPLTFMEAAMFLILANNLFT